VTDRDRRLPIGRRWIAGLGVAGAIALALPIAISALGPAGAPLQPLGGAVSGAEVLASTPPVGSGVTGGGDTISLRPRTIDPDASLANAPRTAPPVATLTGYQWPIKAGRVTLPFKAIPGGTRIKDGKLFHDGLDMASFCGAPVGAAHAGVVLAAGRRFDDHVGWIGDLTPYYALLDRKKMWNDLPNVVVIDDGNGYRSVYAHFRNVSVKPGQRIKAGQLIGYEGATGHASGCHVHYGIFSPLETKTFGVRADILRRLKLPKLEIARIDPLLVLPGGDVALKTRQIGKAIKAAASAKAAADRFTWEQLSGRPR
jgi:murein DD-endopeptidase MepM/ murein hydrolase activator NlpD